MYLWLRLDAVVLNPVLLAHFDHCSRRFFVTDDLCSAVITVVVVTPLRFFSDLAPCFNAFKVSYWCFLDPLFKLYWFHVAGVALPCHRIRHGRRQP